MKKLWLIPLIVPTLLLNSCVIYDDNNIDHYQEILKSFRDSKECHSELCIFPETVDKNKVINFQTRHNEAAFEDNYLFYVSVQYDSQEQVDSELERLEQIEVSFRRNGKTKKVLVTHRFGFIYYVTIYQVAGNYEYAWYNENDPLKIAYVFNQKYQWSSVKVTEKLTDNPVGKSGDWDDNYNMYYQYEGSKSYYVED